jgi:hypothetical protein
MDESDYWLSLEFRICREFAGMSDNHLRFLWCDGFTPQRYLLDDPTPRITGRAWICNGQRQDEWDFTLFLPHPVDSPDKIDWASLLPSENVTRWLAVDQRGKRIQIEPSAAVPDLA